MTDLQKFREAMAQPIPQTAQQTLKEAMDAYLNQFMADMNSRKTR